MQLRKDGILYISSSPDNVEQAKSDIDDFLEETRRKYSNDSSPNRTVIKFFKPLISDTFILNEIKEDKQYFELLNEINIEIEDREVFVKGDEEKKKRFTVFLRNRVMMARDLFRKSNDQKKEIEIFNFPEL